MMRQAWGLALALLAAACAATDNSPQGMCERKAEQDPTVRELMMLSGTNVYLELENQRTLKLARQQAKNRCLADLGLVRPGGVEPIYKPPGS